MNICIVGKYPPIEGGVSMETYWLCRGLAERGHQVFVVTNAHEVEKPYRMFMDREDDRWLEPTFSESGGSVTIIASEPFSSRRLSHIPQSSAFVSQLAGLAAKTVRSQNCDVILGYYLEPYGVAAHLAATWSGVPYIIKHAGSDIDRLMLVPGLAETYRQVFCKAAAILTRPHLAGRFLSMGIDESRIVVRLGFDLPDVFSPTHSIMNVEDQLRRAADWMDHVPAPLKQKRQYNSTLPTIGLFGKIGETKGSYDLIAALARLKQQGHDFNFLCMVGGMGFSSFANALITAGLADRTWLLPFLPHWRVPGFIRACTAVCFLERDFPIAIHGPGVAREILACGTCLIVSGEIAQKQRLLLDFRSRENCFIVDDPKNHEKLAAVIQEVIIDPDRACRIGIAGESICSPGRRMADGGMMAAYELLFQRVQNNAPPYESVGEKAESTDLAALAARSLLPRTTRLAQRLLQPLPPFDNHKPPVEAAMHFCTDLISDLQRQNSKFPLLQAVAELERTALRVLQNAADNGMPFLNPDVKGDRRLSTVEMMDLIPERNRHIKIFEVAFNIDAVDRVLKSDFGSLEHMEEKDSIVLIQPSPNFSVKLAQISPDLRALLELCDGRLTVGEIIASTGGTNARAEYEPSTVAKICTALLKLHARNVINFNTGHSEPSIEKNISNASSIDQSDFLKKYDLEVAVERLS